MIEYKTLKQDGHCSHCGKDIRKDIDVTTTVTFYFRSKNPKVNICRQCAYDIFYAPILSDKKTGIVPEQED